MTRSELIYLEVLESLASGIYEVGDKLPAESVFVKKLRASKSSVHQAIRKLEEDGIVTRSRRGTIFARAMTEATHNDLVRSLSKKICVIYTNKESYDKVHWSEVALNALERKLAGAGITVVFQPVASDMSEKKFSAFLLEIMQSRPVGIVISMGGGHIHRHLKNMRHLIIKQNIPLYLHYRGGGIAADLPCHSVSLDAFADGVTIGDIIHSAGRQNVLFLGNTFSGLTPWGQLRCEGVKTGLSLGEGPADDFVFYDSALDLFDKIKDSDTPPVVVAVNNEVAADFIDRAKRQDLWVPRDYQLIAFDDHADYFSYNISSLRVPQEKIGRLFGELILSKSAFTDATYINIRVKSEYVERQTFKLKSRH